MEMSFHVEHASYWRSKSSMLGIDDVDCNVPTGTSAALMEFSMGAWGWGVVEVRDELLIQSLLQIFRSCIAGFTSCWA